MKPNFSDFDSLAALIFRPAPGQVYADLAGELAILDSKTGVYYGLDPVGARIWSLILEFKAVNEIRSILLEEYEVEAEQLEGDMAHLLSDLHGKALIEVAPPGSKPPQAQSEQAQPEFH
jgi:hypothetical protein